MQLARKLIRRRLARVALCLTAGLTLPVAAQQQPNAAQTPVESMSLKQATDWLKEVLPKNSSRFDASTNRLARPEQIKFDDCSLKYLDVTYYDYFRTKQREFVQIEVAFSLSDIDPTTVRLIQRAGYWAVAYQTRERKPTITLLIRMPGQKAKTTDIYYFPFQKRELGEPVANVFAQAVKQCLSNK